MENKSLILAMSCCIKTVLGQLPTKDNFPPDKNKAQPLPTGPTIPMSIPSRTTPHLDHFHGIKPLIKTNYLYGEELSWWGVVRIRIKTHNISIIT